ncbi:MAG: polysaccharide biosynthesis/export family protein, partial [Bacteroidales bacterium]|nr:polysaccharide biosynthesis/export family protein [Bacteroidales bacterium]
MQKIRVFLLGVFLLAAVPAYAQMSDSAIITYLTEGVAAGKTEAQLGNELLSKGVSIQQIQRLLKTYRSGNVNLSGMPSKISKLDDVGTVSRRSDAPASVDESMDAQPPKADKDQPAERVAGKDSLSRKKSKLYDKEGKKIIYGHNMFNNPRLTFEPNENAATPEDYVLGPEDEVIIDIWGVNEATIRKTITPEGRIILSQVGPVQLSGLTIKQATAKIRRSLSKL